MPTAKKTTKKKPSAKRTVTSKKKTPPKTTAEKLKKKFIESPVKVPEPPAEKQSGARTILLQTVPLLLVLLSFLLLVCLVAPGVMGWFGAGMHALLSGLLGAGSFLVPVLLAIIAIMFRKDAERNLAGLKFIYGPAICLLTSVILQFWANPLRDAAAPWSVGDMWTRGQVLLGGGVLGGLLGEALHVVFGAVGTPILSIAGILIFLLLLFNLTPYTIYIALARRIRAQQELMAQREEEERARATFDGTRFRVRRAHAEQKTPPPADALPDRTPSGTSSRSAERKPKDRHSIKLPLDMPVDKPEVTEDVPAPTAREEETPVPDMISDIPVSIYGKSQENGAEQCAPAPAPQTESSTEAPTEEEELELFFDDSDAPAPKPAHIPPVRVRKSKGIAWDTQTGEVLSDSEDGAISDDVMASFVEGRKTRPAGGEVNENGMITEGEAVPSDEFALAIKRLSEMEGILPAENRIDPVEEVEAKPYELPPVTLLKPGENDREKDVSEELNLNATRLVDTLKSFRVRTRIVAISRGPAITRYELAPEEGIKVRSIVNLVDDIALNLATTGVRIEAPIPGKSAVGVEVPNKAVELVALRDLIDTPKFRSSPSLIMSALGMDVAGAPIFLDIAKMPHLLIAGTTGSGKSVSINCMLVSLLYRASPDQVKLIMIDPKKVELNIYNGLPHLLVPVVSDPKKAAGALHWAVTEMERRFEMIEAAGVRDLKHYNASIEGDPDAEFLPQIVIVIDELADLMMTSRDEVETSICRIAQKARAAGMHLIIGTQRPSVNVVTGVIKANIPSRIAFKVAGQMDSRVILDAVGAEKLIGNGDMLYAPVGCTKPMRVQGAFVSSEEIDEIVSFIKSQSHAAYDPSVISSIDEAAERCGNKKSDDFGGGGGEENFGGEGDPMLKKAIALAVESGKISTSLIQRRLSLGYGRAAKLIDRMEQMGIVGAPDGQKPRQVLITQDQFTEMIAGGFDEDFD